MKSALKHVGRVVVGMLPAALLARLGVPAFAAAVFLAVIVLGVACCVISSGDRSDTVTRMIYARRGDARCLMLDPPAASSHASRRHRRQAGEFPSSAQEGK